MVRGGRREGAGRPRAEEPSERIRVPASMVEDIRRFVGNRENVFCPTPPAVKMPLYSSRIPLGMPDEAVDDIEGWVTLDSLIIKEPGTTFLFYAKGDSMIDAGIYDGDLVIATRWMEPRHGKIVVAEVDGQATVKYIHHRQDGVYLVPANKAYREIPIDPDRGAVIRGVVINTVRSHA